MTLPGWASRLPTGWRALPLKALASYVVSNVDKVPAENEKPVRLCNYTDVYKNEFIHPELNLMRTTATSEEIDKFHLERGDVIITKDSESWDDIAIPALVRETANDMVCGYHLALIRPQKGILEGRFLHRCLQSKDIRLQLELASTGVTRYGLPKDEIGKLLIPIPPRVQQVRIADYLDRETAAIDRLIAEKEQMSELQEEKCIAQINNCVRHGINPEAPLKPSGLKWLGSIPCHWETRRMKFVGTIGNGSTPSLENAGYWSDDETGYPWLNSSVVNDIVVKGVSRRVTELALKECHLPKILPPALLVGITGQGRTRGMASILQFEATINQHVAFIKPFKDSCSYLQSIITTAYPYLRSESDGAGSTKGAITCEQLSNFAIPVPPVDEQRLIITAIEEVRHNSAEIESALSESISILKERRSALITAAVTGQIPESEMTS
jgi:type I restriction enzyme S subunit